jgi:anterior pharynx defective protein 1
MTQYTLWSSLFIAFSAPLAIFYFAASQNPKLVIMFVSSAFMWLLAALATSIVWNAIPPLQDDFWFIILVSVPIQESFRYLWWKMLRKSEKGLDTLSPDSKGAHTTRERIALVSGLGFGCMSGVLQTANMLDIMSGPGMVPARGCPSQNLFTLSSFVAGMLILLNTCWGVIAFKGWHITADMRRSALSDWRVFFVLLSHYTVSFITLNSNDAGSCEGTLIPIATILIICVIMAWRAAGMRLAPRAAAGA